MGLCSLCTSQSVDSGQTTLCPAVDTTCFAWTTGTLLTLLFRVRDMGLWRPVFRKDGRNIFVMRTCTHELFHTFPNAVLARRSSGAFTRCGRGWDGGASFSSLALCSSRPAPLRQGTATTHTYGESSASPANKPASSVPTIGAKRPSSSVMVQQNCQSAEGADATTTTR